MKLNQVALGIAVGVVAGLCILLSTIWVMLVGGGEHLILLSKFYPGYQVSIVGAILGLVYGFIEGFIGGWLLGAIYNRFSVTQA